jgi:hypothetical protein
VLGLATLEVLPAPPPAGTVTITRTFDGASGPPAQFATLEAFVAGVGGPSPGTTHAAVSFATIEGFLDAVGTAGDPTIFVDEAGNPRGFPARSRLFDLPIELQSRSHVLEVAFEAPQLSAGQVLYLRALRGQTPTP